MTSVETLQLDVKPADQRVIIERPRTIGYEYWTMSDREWGDRLCGDRDPHKRPRGVRLDDRSDRNTRRADGEHRKL